MAMGAMRLSEVPEARAVETLRAASAIGVTFIDSADVYGAHDRDAHGNEQLLAAHVPKDVRIGTKGGLIRGPGRWRPDGRAKTLHAASEGSRAALGRSVLDLYMLHAPDVRTPIATTARALDRLLQQGHVRSVGLCNVTVDQLREAEAHVPVAAVQVALSPYDVDAVRSGIIEYCFDRGIRVFAHSPFGGPRRAHRVAKDAALRELAGRRNVAPHALVLAWHHDLGLVPLPGPTRPEHVEVIAAGARLRLSDEDRRALDEQIPLGAWLRPPPRAKRRPPSDSAREIVMIMGMPAAGKTTAVGPFVASGYERFNRDEAGGTIAKLHRRLDAYLARGGGRAVLDNTYATRATRHGLIEVAWKHGRSVRCIWLTTSPQDAALNAVRRLWDTFGRLPGPDEIRAASKTQPNVFGPEVLSRYRQSLEVPSLEEGLDHVEQRPFRARPWPGEAAGMLVAANVLRRAGPHLAARAGPVAVIAWWPNITDDDRGRRVAEIEASVGRPVSVLACTHAANGRCWCLLPLPGLAFAAIATLKLDPGRSLWLGPNATHRRAAEAVGMPFERVPEDGAMAT